MDSKFYVSYEAARLLKEKGYQFVWGYDSIHPRKVTKAEAIDWLESKGIVISVVYDNLGIIGKKHYRSIINTIDKDGSESGSPIYLPSYDGDIRHYPTRLEAEEAAIIKACELL